MSLVFGLSARQGGKNQPSPSYILSVQTESGALRTSASTLKHDTGEKGEKRNKTQVHLSRVAGSVKR